MARVSRRTNPFPNIIHTGVPILLLFILFAFLAGGSVATGHDHIDVKNGHLAAKTNSCSVTWRSASPRPTVIFRMPALNFWTLGSAVVGDVDFDDLDMDEAQFEVYRMDRINLAIQWAECLVHDWPELDLKWCLADWHDGKLVPESL
jgi:hypothetical protein